MKRRRFLQVLGGGAAALALPRPAWTAEAAPSEFFVFVHASGGWDVTLTLPEGRRTTFAFTPEINGLQANAKWSPPPDVQFLPDASPCASACL